MLDQRIAQFRMMRHDLQAKPGRDAVKICGDICGAQAQLMSAAYLQLWTRNSRLTRAAIDAALWSDRTLVKTSLMRQTVHLIPAADFPIYIAAVQSARVADALRVMARCNVTVKDADALTTAIVGAVAAGPLTQPEIRAKVLPKAAPRVRSYAEKVWSILRIRTDAQGLLCYGSGEGNQVRFHRSDDWLPGWKPVAEDEAQRELLRRYLRAYGPATAHDFAHWAGISVKIATRVYGEIANEFAAVQGWGAILAEDEKALKSATPAKTVVKLLPAFDPYLLAHSRKGHLVEERHYKLVYRNQGWISPVILVDGRIAGTWSHKVAGRKLGVELAPFGRLARDVRTAIERDVSTMAGFLGAGDTTITTASAI